MVALRWGIGLAIERLLVRLPVGRVRLLLMSYFFGSVKQSEKFLYLDLNL